jgi:nucleoside-diphosphate-sugar epimerase
MRKKLKRIAILGATGYIGKALIYALLCDDSIYELYLFSRSKESLEKLSILFRSNISSRHRVVYKTLDEFMFFEYDVVVHTAGISDLSHLHDKNQSQVLMITEELDQLLMKYLMSYDTTVCIVISSGAIYKAPLSISDAVTVADYYALAKKESEERHRQAKEFSIIDIRVFSFFSRFIDTGAHFLMSEIIRSLKDKKTLITNSDNIVRDFVSASDLLELIKKIIEVGPINDSFDIYSKKPITKFELLQFLHKKYGLIYEVRDFASIKKGISGSEYFSENKKAKEIGYYPKQTSLEVIDKEVGAITINI